MAIVLRAKKMKLIEDKVIYECQLYLLDSFMSLDTSDASQTPFSTMLCIGKNNTCTYVELDPSTRDWTIQP